MEQVDLLAAVVDLVELVGSQTVIEEVMGGLVLLPGGRDVVGLVEGVWHSVELQFEGRQVVGLVEVV
jgi:hypothetical protein